MKHLINKIRDQEYRIANSIIERLCGIVDFFSGEYDKNLFVASHEKDMSAAYEDRVSYGDWQTPENLSIEICKKHLAKYGNPDIVIEPTCGLGSFVIAALDVFQNISELYAIEINGAYTSELKYRILVRALDKQVKHNPKIYIYTENFFTFNFSPIYEKAISNNWSVSIIGNPPWVNNSKQGKLNSSNVPIKLNLYNLRGIDAITGKSNFDISEYITLHLLSFFEKCNGGISLLLKNSVIRNILIKQKQHPLSIGHIHQDTIDTNKEFNVSVEASCFYAQLRCTPSLCCDIRDPFTNRHFFTYGWVGNSFVSNKKAYLSSSVFDGTSFLEGRSGRKHDCTPVLELRLVDGKYINGLNEIVTVEGCCIYPLLKSSDINKPIGTNYRKYIIIPQKQIGESTSLLKLTHPLLYTYLDHHADYFTKRKSIIYQGKDRFSIFGIGDYSFKPYKVVVSSLYKKINFSLVLPFNNTPVLIDDTCYQLSFDSHEEAKLVYEALQSTEIKNLINSLVFLDAKRVVTKNLLMRINLTKYFEHKGIKFPNARLLNHNKYRQLSLFDDMV